MKKPHLMKIFYHRNLPHYVPPGGVYFVTFRLQDSIPKEIIEKLQLEHQEELKKIGPLPPLDEILPWSPHRKGHCPKISREREAYAIAYKRYFLKIDDFLDSASFGPHYLKNEAISSLVREKLKEFDEQYYWLVAYSVMSNHVHALLDTYCQLKRLPPDSKITKDNYVPYEKFMQLIKGNSSFNCNKILGRQGTFWQHESYDHLVRTENEFNNIIKYILNNPVKAGLAKNWEDYPMNYLRPEYLHVTPPSGGGVQQPLG